MRISTVAAWLFVGVAIFQAEAAVAEDTPKPSAEPVEVFAAASTTNAIREIKDAFTAATGAEVQVSFGSSATLARQIANGADADVFLSADMTWADNLAEKGYVAGKRVLLGNRLVIVVPADSTLKIAEPADLLSPKVSHIALGEPSSVPAGKYAKQAFEKLGLWEQIKLKIAAADDVRNALAYVETGAAEAGVVYATDAAVSKKVKVAVQIPESLTGEIRYPIVLLKHGEQAASAKKFYDFLQSPESAHVFQKYGFSVFEDIAPTNKE